jgi:hypothetical protein
MLIRILVPGAKGVSPPEASAYEAPYGVIRGEPP